MAGLMKRLFRGADTPAEEKAEARAVRSGKITPKQYVAGEKSEGEKEPGMMARAKALKSGKMSPAAYAKHESKEKAMKCGGKVKKMAFGGIAAGPAPVGAKMGAAQAAAVKTMLAGRQPAPIKAPLNPATTGGGKPAMQMAAQQAAVRTPTGGGKPAPARPMAKGGGVEAKGKTAGKAVKMAKGGSARGCGIAVKGKTKGRMV